MTYIDLNMVRAGVVEHPSAWAFCGYHEIQSPRKRKGIIDIDCLTDLLGFDDHAGLKAAHAKWVANKLQGEAPAREKQWTKSIAVGSKSFIEKIKEALGFRARGRQIICSEDTFELREKQSSFGRASEEEGDNTFDWENNPLHS
jgi:putative transposase